jgi:chromatin assembly factor 1 subunit A
MGKMDGDATPAQNKSQLSGWILPFFLLENTELAPNNRFIKSNNQTSDVNWLLAQDAEVKAKGLFKSRRAQTRRVAPVKEMVAKLEGSEDEPIDLTASNSGAAAAESLKQVPFKVLHFKEDVRPPYQGTYTRPVSPRSARRISRRPTYRGLPDTDYDYDSEAEWQEPEPDDEDLEGDDDLSEEEDGAEEMDDFLDDEADAGKRLVSSSDVEPISTGICWDGETAMQVAGFDLDQYQMQVMHDDQRLPIDPYSATHWKDDRKVEVVAESTTTMQPPRLPLANVSVNSMASMRAFVTGGASSDPVQKENPAIAAVRGRPKDPNKPAKPVKLIPDDLLPAFKIAVDGSDLNKIALVEILKKQFAKCSKDAIKGTLDTVAVRMGVKEADKRWVLK